MTLCVIGWSERPNQAESNPSASGRSGPVPPLGLAVCTPMAAVTLAVVLGRVDEDAGAGRTRTRAEPGEPVCLHDVDQAGGRCRTEMSRDGSFARPEADLPRAVDVFQVRNGCRLFRYLVQQPRRFAYVLRHEYAA